MAEQAGRAGRKSKSTPDSLQTSPRELCFVSDATPGIRRRRVGRHFSYLSPDGTPLRDPDAVRRIKALAIPPAWTDVWICPDPRGHIQATGRDARGRKQYRYHPRFRAVRDQAKYEHLIEFARMLPHIRRRVQEDLRRRGLHRERVLATIVALLDMTHIRVGNEEYARTNGSYGLTTLRNTHADVTSTSIRFRFRGKSGIEHEVGVSDRRLARVVRQCQELPGQALFQYVDESGEVHGVESGDVNAYLREITGADVTAKDFRTWAGTVLAASALCENGACESAADMKRSVIAAIDAAAASLGNTRAICRSCYIHPTVLAVFEQGRTLADYPARPSKRLDGLTQSELSVLSMLVESNDPGRRNQRVKAQAA
jgi:DNA topoisomerase-1